MANDAEIREAHAAIVRAIAELRALALQLPFLKVSESMGNHDSKIVDAYGVD